MAMGWRMSRGACSGLAVDTYERTITIAAVKYLVFKKLKMHRHLDDEMLPQLRALMLEMLQGRPRRVAGSTHRITKHLSWAALRPR
ncbi:hypothetical protein FIBSPDRAFT_849939 [Athelia psychrophila]|uniref:Uncharacterized protein n=1 Tax=Athelia psychrophila TaxID=1759441 RepID=A0A166TSD1_9AGAM|nr:hypothetical protein FIBSPDRAFT_849939 [Fibularhizoctonia sp. CBS 109695]